MFKRLAIAIFTIGFVLVVLLVFVFKAPVQASELEFSLLGAEVVSTEETTVDYHLPYPGILPDHSLYFLKMIRDRIELFLTTDPLKRAEKLLHFADKRIGAAKVLVEGNKQDLGVTTAIKAEKYLERAVSQEETARDKGKETEPFLKKLEKACLKHEETLLGIEKKAEREKEKVNQLLDYPRKGLEEARKRLKFSS